MLNWWKAKAWPWLKKRWWMIPIFPLVLIVVFVMGRNRRDDKASAPAGSVPTVTPEEHQAEDKRIEEAHQEDLNQIDEKYEKLEEDWDSWIDKGKRGE